MGVAEISLKFWENQRKRAKQNRRNVMQYDPYSPDSWDIEGHGTVYVGDMFFDDSYLIYLTLDEITLETVSLDDRETKLEPVFWLSSKDLDVTKELSEREMVPYFHNKK